MLDRIAQGHAVDGMEALSPVLVDGMELLVDVLPSDTHVLVCDPELVRGRAIDLVKTSEEFLHASWAAAAGGGQAPIDLGASSYQPLADVRAAALARGLAWWTLSPFSAGPGTEDSPVIRTDDGEIVDFRTVVSSQRRRVADDRRTRAGHLPGRGRGRGHRDRPTAGRRLAGGAHRRGQGHDRPDGGGADRARVPGAGPRSARRGARRRDGDRGAGRSAARLRRRRHQAGPVHRRRPVRTAHRRQGRPQDAGPAQEHDRPAGAHPRRPGGAQPARRRSVRGDGAAQRRRLGPGVPGDRVRPLQARPTGRPALRADGLPGPGHPLRRRRAPDPGQDGWRRLVQAEGPGPQGRPRDRR